MDGITQGILNDNKAILNEIKSLITTPTLINTDIRQGAKYAIPLMCETNQMSAAAEVSESLVITYDSKKYMSDNVAPGSRSWHLTGYIIGLRRGMDELSNKYQPTLKFHTDMVWSWFNHGALLIFKDGNARIFKNIVIKDLQTSQVKDAQDAIAFTMTLKEINVMTSSYQNIEDTLSFTGDSSAMSTPVIGSGIGNPLKMGSTMATVGSL